MSDTPDPTRDDPREEELPSDPDAPGTYLDDEQAPDVAEPNEPA